MEAPPSPPPATAVPLPPSATVKPDTKVETGTPPKEIVVSPAKPFSPSSPAPITIPSYSRWFSWSEIHDTERKLLPEFFDGRYPSKNPSVYKYYRDSIIRRFWESPARRITFTECRRGLVGDVNSIRRVFDFLETWGLINYTPSTKQVSAAAASAAGKGADEKKGNEEGSEKENPAQKVCTSCGAICNQACFAPPDKAEIVLCARCFVRGNYRAGLTSGDFKRVDIGEGGAVGQMKSEWTDKETLHLLEAVLHFGDDWKKVAEHVGNGRSQKDCVARFVKLPFGEQFMGSMGSESMGGSSWRNDSVGCGVEGENTEELSAAHRLHLTPLADTSNPIMAQVAFLSAMAGSEVAEAAAKAAIAALSEDKVVSSNDVNEGKNGYLSDVNAGEVANENGYIIQNTIEESVREARLQLEKEQESVEDSISYIIEVKMKEIQDKISNFEKLELLLEKECLQLKNMRHLYFADQLSLQQMSRCNSFDGDESKLI